MKLKPICEIYSVKSYEPSETRPRSLIVTPNYVTTNMSNVLFGKYSSQSTRITLQTEIKLWLFFVDQETYKEDFIYGSPSSIYNTWFLFSEKTPNSDLEYYDIRSSIDHHKQFGDDSVGILYKQIDTEMNNE